jgi:hypothetical protein
MANFPMLNSGAVMQYPAQRSTQFSNYVAWFVDGAEQRYRECSAPLSRWIIRLDLLDEAELHTLEQFFLSGQGAFGSFTFTDPWDSTTLTNCSLEGDVFDLRLTEEGRGGTNLVVRENRG